MLTCSTVIDAIFNIVVNHYKKRSVSIRKARLRYVAMRLIIYPSITVEDLTLCRSHSRRKRRPRISCVTKNGGSGNIHRKKKKKKKSKESEVQRSKKCIVHNPLVSE